MATDTECTQLRRLLETLPQELYDEIFDRTFEFTPAVRIIEKSSKLAMTPTVRIINNSIKLPATLQVNRATRKTYAPQYFRNGSIFSYDPFDDRQGLRPLESWLLMLDKAHLQLIKDIKIHRVVNNQAYLKDLPTAPYKTCIGAVYMIIIPRLHARVQSTTDYPLGFVWKKDLSAEFHLTSPLPGDLPCMCIAALSLLGVWTWLFAKTIVYSKQLQVPNACIILFLLLAFPMVCIAETISILKQLRGVVAEAHS